MKNWITVEEYCYVAKHSIFLFRSSFMVLIFSLFFLNSAASHVNICDSADSIARNTSFNFGQHSVPSSLKFLGICISHPHKIGSFDNNRAVLPSITKIWKLERPFWKVLNPCFNFAEYPESVFPHIDAFFKNIIITRISPNMDQNPNLASNF